MTMIAGVGDEVVQFVGVVLVGAVAALAWWSTNARPDRYRTVLVMRSRSHPVTVSIRPRSSNLMLTSSQATTTGSTNSSTQSAATETSSASSAAPVSEAPPAAPEGAVGSEGAEGRSRVIPLQEMDSIVDADMAMLDNNRLHFYRRVDPPSRPQTVTESASEDSETSDEVELESASSAQIIEMDSIVSAMEGNEPTTNVPTTAAPVDKPSVMASSSVIATNNSVASDSVSTEAGRDTVDGNKILIKLKYLNDTLKEVEGNLDEKLKDFTTRHFSTELSSESRVRLIFNGRVLVDERATLRACGLHHRAVVHCLVHPKRPAQPLSGHTPAMERPAGAAEAAPERAWDLENILMTLVSVALTVVWFFRCEYSNMFTASASVALFGLTVFYSVAIFGLYLSDTFHFDRRPAPAPQPAPQAANNA